MLQIIWFIFRGNLGTLRMLAVGADRFSRGDHSVRVEAAGAPEVRSAVEAFNNMANNIEGLITSLSQAEAALRKANEHMTRKAQELARSNAELEQFAYVASHDLQEPLRMVSSYTQLIVRRYGERLDSDGKEFMDFIVDGAARMKQLIEDLLAYSRVGTRGKELKATDCEVVLQKALTNLRATVEASSALVTHDPLPTIEADATQLVQLFQNLIGNAIKFRGTNAPCVHVSAKEQDDAWLFGVEDNGIGIDPQYSERIFMVFQRLHNKAEYPGTGIGLAICKKVIDRHGGRIWVESKSDSGSNFYFTLPKTGSHTHD
jgi:light-regulated signal transduction histidine kinase (bacteriophytochrome)